MLLMTGAVEGSGLPLIRKKSANEWGRGYLWFIQGGIL
jgi:hypothetical protein